MTRRKIVRNAAVAAGIVALQAGMFSLPMTAQAASENDHITVNIGYQASAGPFLLAMKKGWIAKDFAQVGAKVKYYQFDSGSQFFSAIAGNHLDFAGSGNTPPVMGQAANVPFKEIAVVGLGTNSQAILVQKGSSIHSLKDLKGKKIAVASGSSAYYFLFQALAKAHLKPTDVQIEQLQPSAAEPAFDSHQVDAWAVWDPYISSEVVQNHARELIDGKALDVQDTEFAIARTAFAKTHPTLVKKYIQALNQATKWQLKHPKQAEAIYAKVLKVSPAVIAHDVKDAPPVVQPVSASIIKRQQSIADFMYGQHVILSKINVSQVVDNSYEKAALK